MDKDGTVESDGRPPRVAATVLARAEFDPKLKLYIFLNSCLLLAVTLIGLPLLPIWFFVGPAWARRYFQRLSCVLTDRALMVKKGIIFRSEKTIPLEKIQDLSMLEGPVLRWLGLCSIRIETAGTSAPQGAADASLTGVVDARAFRDRVLEERDRVAGYGLPPTAPAGARAAAAAPDGGGGTEALLTETRDCLRQIEGHLRDRD